MLHVVLYGRRKSTVSLIANRCRLSLSLRDRKRSLPPESTPNRSRRTRRTGSSRSHCSPGGRTDSSIGRDVCENWPITCPGSLSAALAAGTADEQNTMAMVTVIEVLDRRNNQSKYCKERNHMQVQ